ncbi:AMP-binding [Fusarium oxysporum f. sp. vasinfectum]|nr:AMP-binding [Fusarium oxysporum f. sp. vasinfectum]
MANDFKAMVEAWPGCDSRLVLRATFNDECMHCDAAELMLREMSLIISSILEQPDESFLGNCFMSDSSLRSCIDLAESQDLAPHTLMHSQFEAHAKSNPDDHALSLADYIVSIMGPLTGTVVPIHIEKSPALYVAILAQRRHELIVRTEGQLVLVSSVDKIPMGEALPSGIIPIDVFPFTRESERDMNARASDAPITDPTNVAYMIWTSGTTGAPKGVPINHSSAYTSIDALIEAIPGTRDGQPVRCVQFSQPTFDVSIQDLFFTWSSRGVLISAPRAVMLGSFVELANVTGATNAHLTPTFSAGLQRSSFQTLQTITMIGEKLPQPVADDWGQDMRAFNTYGPAEATIVSTLREFGNQHKNIKSGNIGWPLKSVSVFVTRDKKFVMKHAVGELALGGPQLSPGYLKQPETNKEKYIWNEEANDTLYYTGDLVRMLSDGSLEYLSQTDDLVKLGGIRVELTFIAAPQVAQTGDAVPTILLNDTAIGIARAAIREASITLPDHMKPSTFIVVPSIPKTQSAKANRRALQALLHSDIDIDKLKQAWATVCRGNEVLRTCFIPVAALQKPIHGCENDSGILQVMLEQHEVDWEYIECKSKSYQQNLHRRIVALQDRHQSSYFQNPPWAITIMDDFQERTMIFSIHHVLYDGTSLGYIMNDVCCAYGADARNRPQLRNALSLLLPSKKASLDAQEFWEQELSDYADFDVPSWPDLTGERTSPERGNIRRFITETVPLSVPTAQLEAKTAELGVSSVASVVRAAFGHVLLSYPGSSGVVFAETLSDRVLDADVDRTIGPFISVVPMPMSSNGTVREVLAEQHRLSTKAKKHHLMAASAGTIWDAKVDDFGLSVEHRMALNVFREPDGTVILEASSLNTIMGSKQLAIFTRQIDALVGAMLYNPDVPLKSLPSYIEKGLLSISALSPSDAVKESANMSPVDWVETTTGQHPECTAVEETLSITAAGVEQPSMSYGELNASANRVVAYLNHCGIKNRAVALCSQRSLASYPVLVGIMESGCSCLPIDQGLPDDRKAFLIEDGDAPIFPQEFLAFSSENSTYVTNPEDTAYILYTSGSTGKPKGVMISRANLSSFIESLSEFVCRIAPATLELGGKGRWLGQASPAFDPHIAETFFSWRHGMTASTGARPLLMDDLRLTLDKLEITHAGFVPTLLDQADIRPEHCPSLRLLSVGEKRSPRESWIHGALPVKW